MREIARALLLVCLSLMVLKKALPGHGTREVQAEPLLPSARCGLRERDQFGELA
jgi:hypothetical protein